MSGRTPTKRVLGLLLLVVGGAAGPWLGCRVRELHSARRPGPVAFDVQVVAGETGSEAVPLPFSHQPVAVELTVRALTANGAVDRTYEGTASLSVAPWGKITSGANAQITLQEGEARNVVVSVSDVHGSACSIWVENRGTPNAPGNYATGLSTRLVARNPTINQLQDVSHLQRDRAYETSALKGDFVEIELAGRDALVTGVTQDGFYVTDISEPTDAYNGLFVYTHSQPRSSDGRYLEERTRIIRLAGTVEEYYGFTELSFPSWKTSGDSTGVAAATSLSAAAADTGGEQASARLERFESRLVEISEVSVCAFDAQRLQTYTQYGQWAVAARRGDCSSAQGGGFSVVSGQRVPRFDPRQHEGQTLRRVRGNLRYHSAAEPPWIIYVRREEDIVVQ